MTRLAFILALGIVVYLIGYFKGRKEVVDDIRRMTKELKERE